MPVKNIQGLEIALENKPGSLSLMGETLGKHKISLEGGGVFANGDIAIAHFLVSEGNRARAVLNDVGIEVVQVSEVIIQKLRQGVPGQLGMFCRRMADAGVSILTQYSDHNHQLIIVVDDYEKASEVSQRWMKEWWG